MIRAQAFAGWRRPTGVLLLVPLLLMTACSKSGRTSSDNASNAASAASEKVVGAWSAAPYGPFPLGPLTMDTPLGQTPGSITVAQLDGNQARDQSFRMIVNPTLAGRRARVRLSNLEGDRPVRFESVSLAHAMSLVPTLKDAPTPVTFAGKSFVIAQPGQEVVSDLVDFPLQAREDIAISFHVAGSSGPVTWHAVSFAPQYLSPAGSGDVASDRQGTSFRGVSVGWFFVSGLDVVNDQALGAIVALGDSITDGAYQVLNQRWTDRLAARLDQAGMPLAILNQGINSNTVNPLTPEEKYRGAPAVARFDRDVLQRSGVRGVILFEGTNDLGAGLKAEAIISGLSSLIGRARNAGLCVFMGTIPPRDDAAFGWLPDGPLVKEPERLKINDWIRNAAPVDGVIDFAEVLAVPGLPGVPNAAFYFPDLLHPNPLGFSRMGDAIDIRQFMSKCTLG